MKKKPTKLPGPKDEQAPSTPWKNENSEQEETLVQLFSELSLGWMPDSNQLTWKEFNDDKNFPDQSEWCDQDYTFYETHPDWCADDKVKEYFRKAQEHKYVKAKLDDDYDQFVNKFVAIKRNETKKIERMERYE